MLVPTNRRPTSPGKMLLEEFLQPLGLTQTAFAAHAGMTYPRLNAIVNGKRGITTDTALRFARALGTSPEFWLNLQLLGELYDLKHSTKAAEIWRIRRLAKALPAKGSK
ncbi:MAG TPA: HigA family addiction module antitoxin [Candidatus Elarobacter sp.]|jgi:addiction module HigA family antidote|nr:HigA family addiction module antitoxin [Candidatus Elarobacter sp.]